VSQDAWTPFWLKAWWVGGWLGKKQIKIAQGKQRKKDSYTKKIHAAAFQ
jgi:hypothetical protein